MVIFLHCTGFRQGNGEIGLHFKENSGCWVENGEREGRVLPWCMQERWGFGPGGPVDGSERFWKQNQRALLRLSLVQSREEGIGARLGVSQKEQPQHRILGPGTCLLLHPGWEGAEGTDLGESISMEG